MDEEQRTRRASGTLILSVRPARSRTAQAQAGGADRRATEEGGHYIAARFNGPTDSFNRFAQDKNFNRSAYKSLENKWAAALRDGKRVFVTITPHYEGISKRAQSITAQYTINETPDMKMFPNKR